MAEAIAIIILLTSLIGMGTIFFRKINVLVDLPVVEEGYQEDLYVKLRNKFQKVSPINSFNFINFKRKLFSQIRIFILKAENKISRYLERLHQKEKEKNNSPFSGQQENYWQNVKKIKNNSVIKPSKSQKRGRKKITIK